MFLFWPRNRGYLLKMTKNFEQLLKEIRIALHPGPDVMSNLTNDQLKELSINLDNMIVANGYTVKEFDKMYNDHKVDFNSPNPNEWIIKYEPDYMKNIPQHLPKRR